MSQKKEKCVLFLYFAGFLIIAATLAIFQPLGDTALFVNPPDEHARILVPWYICQHGVLPTGLEEEVRIPGYGFSYALYNIFPYIIQGYMMRFVSLFTQSVRVLLYAGRFVNVLSGTAMAYVVYLLSKRWFSDVGMRWMFCFGVMYLPQCLFVHTYINTDSMCLLSTAVILLALTAAYQEGFTVKHCLLLSGGIIVCALSYYNAYGYILSSIFLFVAYFAADRGPLSEALKNYDWRQMLKKGILISVVVLLGISWQFIRNYILYDGDILGLAIRDKLSIQYGLPEVNPLTSSTYLNRGESIWMMLFGSNFASMTFKSFVGAYGSLSIMGHAGMYMAFLIFFAIGITACFFLRRSQADFMGDLPGWKRIFFHINLFFCIAMPIILLLYYAYAVDFQRQGRYAMPMIIPFMYYVVRGYQKLLLLPRLSRFRWFRGGVIGVPVLLLISSALYMTYYLSLPLYLESGLSLEVILNKFI